MHLLVVVFHEQLDISSQRFYIRNVQLIWTLNFQFLLKKLSTESQIKLNMSSLSYINTVIICERIDTFREFSKE